jgi:acetyltransferase-like isoleucine patch superfamily enzyme
MENDVRIDPRAFIKRPELVSFGNHISIDCFVYISTAVKMGDWIHIAPSVSIIGGEDGHLTIGNFCAIAAGARIICASDNWTSSMICSFLPIEYRDLINKPIVMGNFCGVATNSILMPGVTMAKGSILGAGSILTHDTVEWGIYVGSPARLVRYRKNQQEILKSARLLGYEV